MLKYLKLVLNYCPYYYCLWSGSSSFLDISDQHTLIESPLCVKYMLSSGDTKMIKFYSNKSNK